MDVITLIHEDLNMSNVENLLVVVIETIFQN